jgi:outer membrane immunogenic protein
MLKRSAVAALLMAAIPFGAAVAADLPTHKEAPAPPLLAQPFSWTGPYVGAIAGYGWADPTGGFNLSSTTLAGLPPVIPVLDAAGSQPLSLRGGLLGVEAGYNWQISNSAVLGIEGDFEGSDVSGAHVVGGIVPVFVNPFTISQSLHIRWQASLRARAGFTPIDHLLVFVTGGPALAQISYSSAYVDPIPEIERKSFSSVKPGFAVGGGAEYAISSQWSVKAEYLYSQFSAATGNGSGLLADGTTAFVAHSTGTFRENSVRFGVNYHFH